ncbi:9b90eabf-28bf-456c-a0fd-5de41575042f [Sclerotinia trifoliorum]|uniref:9b90eabf-28bf-456c-a0fd-5de41575042f n=1 Tax=Sclerotinia trifoliorum TaxID=28548 RepID=A0A8H2W6C2_9HELO|nr:9b90eabf-28bf-456c-a0fd-5de41575042f [Sclerotinia trifoliorum]
MASVLKFFPNTSEPFGPLVNIMVRLHALDEVRLRNIRRDIYAPRINDENIPQLEILRHLGTSKIEFIRESLSNITRTQSRFEIALSNPFLVDRSIHFSLNMLAYAPDLKIMRKRAQDTLKDIVVIDKKEKISTHEHIFSVENFHWSKDVKILLKSAIPPEERESWLNHAKQQCYKRLKPVTATGLTLMILKRRYHYEGYDSRGAIWRNVTIREMLQSDIIYEEFPFQGKGPIIAFDPNRR